MNSAVSNPRAAAPVAFEDGFGERLYAVGAANEPLEVLKISNELSCVSSFEESLRAQATRLADFRHEAFGRVRAVERLDARSSTLVVISDHVRGVRLSEMLAGARKRNIALEFPAAAWLIRQLFAAVAALHESAPDVCHGAIGTERIVVTPDGRLVLVEYVFGPALEEMHFSQERYWRELGIALPRPIGLPHFDPPSDVTQAGAVALALLLGRALEPEEYPGKTGEVLDSANAVTESGAHEPLPAALRAWLRRALHLEPRGVFASGSDAKADLDLALGVEDDAGRAALKSFLSRYAAAAAPERAAEPVKTDATKSAEKADVLAAAKPLDVVAPVPVLPPTPAAATLFAAVTPAPAPLPVPTPAAPAPLSFSETTTFAPAVPFAAPTTSVTPFPTPAASHTGSSPLLATTGSVAPFAPRPAAAEPRQVTADAKVTAPEAKKTVAEPPAAPAHRAAASTPLAAEKSKTRATGAHDLPKEQTEAQTAMGNRPAWARPWAIAGVAAVIALTMGVTMVGRRFSQPAAPVETNGTLEIGTNPEGVAVFIDGSNRGTTPLSLSLGAGAHVLELVTESERRRIPVTMKAGAHVSQFLELPKQTAGLGDLQVRTDPSRAKVTVDGHVFGRSPVLVKGLTPGIHKVVLENESGSFSEDVTIEEGTTSSLVVPMTKPQGGANVSGWIAINAPADLQVYENQRLIGSSRSERIMVAVGRHELELVNEALGFRASRAVEVSPGQVATVRPEWPKGSLALNAQPWAEVFVDGERVGETPIGSVSMAIGTHEIVFRHPELGERRANATVTAGAPTRVSIDMRAK